VADKSGVHFSWANVIKVARILSPPIFMMRASAALSTQKSVSAGGHISAPLPFETKKLPPKTYSPTQMENHKLNVWEDAHWLRVSMLSRNVHFKQIVLKKVILYLTISGAILKMRLKRVLKIRDFCVF